MLEELGHREESDTQNEVNTDGHVTKWNIMKACGKQHMLL
jgi:hypothetical protein